MKKLSSLLLVSTLLVVACGRPGGSQDQVPVAPPPSAGTSSGGGGGNGIDGKPIESFSIRIDRLPEYRQYISPAIKRLARGKGDVIAAYLLWAATQKPWYFVPRPLDMISKSRTGLFMETEQLATQSESEVFVHIPSFKKMEPKQRAELLMHEMVMGARFLMKRPPQEQCEALNRGGSSPCSDPEVLKLAISLPLDPAAMKVMDESDHAAVRALTQYLMNEPDASAERVGEFRKQLKFVFPWDQTSSNIDQDEVVKAFERAAAAAAVYTTASNKKDESGALLATECLFETGDASYENLYLNLLFAAPLGSSPKQEDLIYQVRETNWGSKQKRWLFETRWYYGVTLESNNARGVRYKFEESERIVDQVTTHMQSYEADGQSHVQVDYFLSRENPARLLEVRLSHVKPISKASAPDQYDYVVVGDKPVIQCLLQTKK